MKAQPCSTINKVVCVTINPAFSTVLMNFDRTLDSKNSKNSSEEDFHFINTSLFLSILNFKWWIHHESLQHGSIVQPARDRFLVRHRSADVAAVVSGLPVAHRSLASLGAGCATWVRPKPSKSVHDSGKLIYKKWNIYIHHIPYIILYLYLYYMVYVYMIWAMKNEEFSIQQ